MLDVDDTIYLERDYVRSGFESVGRHLAKFHQVVGVAETLWSGFELGVRHNAFDLALEHHGVDPDPTLVGELVELYRTHRPTIEPLPDASRFLERLLTAGIRGAAITDGPARSQLAKVEALGLADVLDPIVVTEQLGPGNAKPAPLPYVTVEEAHHAQPGECWYLADNPAKDFVTPIERGWTSVRVRRDGALHSDVETPLGVVEVPSLDAIEVAGC